MRATIRTILRGAVGLLAFAALALAVPTVTRAASCKADVTAALFGKKELSDTTEFVWAVEISSPEECARVKFTLNYTETTDEGKDEQFRMPMTMKVRGGTTSARKVSYRIDKKHTMAEWRFEVVDCTPCGAAN